MPVRAVGTVFGGGVAASQMLISLWRDGGSGWAPHLLLGRGGVKGGEGGGGRQDYDAKVVGVVGVGSVGIVYIGES
jgi:hypothetical protein